MSQSQPSWLTGENDSDSDESFSGFKDVEDAEEYDSSEDVINEDEEEKYDKNFLLKSKIQWNNTPMKQKRQAKQANVMKVDGGVTSHCLGISSIKEASELFINEKVKNIIIKHTNYKGNNV